MFNLEVILPTIGYIGIFAIIFAESGLLIGFFLPGDSLLFTAGFLASQGMFDIKLLALLAFAGAVLGDTAGFWFGHKIGRRLFHRQDSFLFHKENLKKAEEFYEKYGKKTIILARFVPVIRTFAPIVAGVGNMHYPTFLSYNIIGGALWGSGIVVAGYYLGKTIPSVDTYLLPIILCIIIVSVAPSAIHILKDKENRAQLISLLKKTLRRLHV